MGTYCDLYILNYNISALVLTEGLDNSLLWLFQSEDFKTFTRAIGDGETETAFVYSTSIKNMKDRLEIIVGATLEKVQSEFEHNKEVTLNFLRENLEDKTYPNIPKAIERLQRERKILENASLSDFIKASNEIIDKQYGQDISKLPKNINPLIIYLLEGNYIFSNFPHNDHSLVLFRALLECRPNEDTVTYDITAIIPKEISMDEMNLFYQDAFEEIDYDYNFEEILILTEGSSDIQILQGAMNVLYPHLTGYYSFMDFGISNASGSASSLVASVKSFVGARIKNRIIALFDNDTAAESAIRGLKKTKLPDNIKILRYPNIKLAENYPTIGTSGISKMNINGLACSIEMYLGQDVLKEKGEFIPVQWKGLDPALGKYQGEILDKSKVVENFKTKIEICLKDKCKIKDYDWTEMEQLLQTIFKAFNSDEQAE